MKMLILLFCILLASCASDMSAVPTEESAASRLLFPYEPSGQCRGCHADQYQQYENSMHARAFTNPLFTAQYFTEVVPQALRDPGQIAEARRCIACHAPAVFMNYTGLVTTPAQAERFETGVTCDFCHTLSGYGENGDYLQSTSGKKRGPNQTSAASSHHAEFSDFLQSSEFCGRCHDATSHFNPEIKSASTYTEWRDSSYVRSGSSCQECHMSKNGYLRGGTAQFNRGQAAHMNVGDVEVKQQEHDRLYNHSFPGAHSSKQLEGALQLDFKIDSGATVGGGRFPFELLVSNEGAGHKMPSGSSELRFMWLVVTATAADGARIPAALNISTTGNISDYSIAGASPDDAAILEDDVPLGSRLYRTVLVDADERQTLFQYGGVKIAFDNRLDATEVRTEKYYISLPPGFSGNVVLEASLYYRSAPSSFSKRIKAPDFSPVLVASSKKTIMINAINAPK